MSISALIYHIDKIIGELALVEHLNKEEESIRDRMRTLVERCLREKFELTNQRIEQYKYASPGELDSLFVDINEETHQFDLHSLRPVFKILRLDGESSIKENIEVLQNTLFELSQRLSEMNN